MTDNERDHEDDGHGLKENISGLGQKIIGEIETFGGILTGDPITQAEGEFNVEVGDLREDIEEDLEAPDKAGRPNREDQESE